MYCPNCGSNQDVSKRFCRICGTNLQAVNQALTGQALPGQALTGQALPGQALPGHVQPVYVPNPFDAERHRESSKALRMTLIGGGLVAYKFFNFVLSGDSPFGGIMVIGFILLVMGISKMVSLRTPYPPYPLHPEASQLSGLEPTPLAPPAALPQPVFSSMVTSESPSRNTNELEPIQQPIASVTEDETRQLGR